MRFFAIYGNDLYHVNELANLSLGRSRGPFVKGGHIEAVYFLHG